MLGWIITALLIFVALMIGGLVHISWRTARRVQRLIPPAGKFVDVDGVRLHYVERGEGPPVIMIHGLGGNLRNYLATIIPAVAKTNHVIAFDRPGTGYSERPAGADATTGTQAAIIQMAIDKLGIEDPLIVGHSLGGAISLSHAVLHPGKARGYVLIAPLASPDQPTPPMFERLDVRSPLLQRLIAWTIGVPLGIRYAREVTAAVFAPQPVPTDFATASGGLLGLRPKAVESNMKDFTAAHVTIGEIQTRYGEINVPVIALFGAEDRVLDAELNIGALEQIPSVEIQRIDGAGHMLMHAEPEAVIAAIRKLDERTAPKPDVAAAS